jgi:hypothetical protein
VCQPAGGRDESRDVGGHVVRLHHELRVVDRGIPPAADLDVELAMVLLGAVIVPGEEAERRRIVEQRDVAHHEHVSTVAERPPQAHFGACPLVTVLRDFQMQGALLVHPRVGGIVVVRAAAIAGRLADVPLVAAERQRLANARRETAGPAGR